MKEMVRPGLAFLWSIASIITHACTGEVPEWMLGLTITCVLWFFGSRQKEKANAQKN